VITCRWAAPEVHAADTYTEKLDVYSFGVVLWELASGDLPFHDIVFDSAVADLVLKGERYVDNRSNYQYTLSHGAWSNATVLAV
jgi:serine/threonine protein kinase